MKRLTFLLGLLGAAVAKGQEPIVKSSDNVAVKANANQEDELARLLQAGTIVRQEPKSGHCPLDGTKGEAVDFVRLIYTTFADNQANTHEADAIIDHRPPGEATCLRCPHCGMLFTETAEKGLAE